MFFLLFQWHSALEDMHWRPFLKQIVLQLLLLQRGLHLQPMNLIRTSATVDSGVYSDLNPKVILFPANCDRFGEDKTLLPGHDIADVFIH